MSRRIFTLADARVAVGRIRPAAERMCHLYRVLEARRPRAILSEQRVSPAYFALVEAFHGTIDAISRQGGVVRDPRQGLVDLPARRGGRIVALRWKVGESGIEFWHDPHEAAFRRKRVDPDGPWE